MSVFIPQVLDDKGNPIVGPALDAVLNRVSSFVMIANLAKIRKATELPQFRGITDVRDNIIVTTYQKIDVIAQAIPSDGVAEAIPAVSRGWVKFLLVNYGPQVVEVALNKDRPFKIVRVKETYEVDYMYAINRLSYIEMQCKAGETATVSILGKY